jgi:hypothetical protein
MKIGIRTFRILKNGNVLIDAYSMEKTGILITQIHYNCGDHLEINAQKRRNPG